LELINRECTTEAEINLKQKTPYYQAAVNRPLFIDLAETISQIILATLNIQKIRISKQDIDLLISWSIGPLRVNRKRNKDIVSHNGRAQEIKFRDRT